MLNLSETFSNTEQQTEQKNKMKISIVLPCYNEEKTIGQVLSKIESLNLPEYEIIVVDDCSTDKSVEIAKRFKNTRVLRHKKNKGYGKTLIDGIKHASGEIIITIDSDGQHDPADIPRLIHPIQQGKCDIVIGSRYLGKYFYKIPLTNRTGEALIEAVLAVFFGINIKNNQGGFRAFHKKTLEIFNESKFHDMAFTTELLMISSIKGYKVKEEPIHLRGRIEGHSRVKKLRLLKDLIKSFVYYFLKKMLYSYTDRFPRFRREIMKPFYQKRFSFFKRIWLK